VSERPPRVETPSAPDRGLVAAAIEARVSDLAAHLRAAGSPVGIGELLAAHRALAAVDSASSADAFFALRAVLCSSHADFARFEAAFAAVFGAPGAPPLGLPEMGPWGSPALPRLGVPGGAEPQGMAVEDVLVPAAWSEQELVREKDFAAYTDAERATARVLLERLARRGPRRLSRRTRPTRRRREEHDLRATVRLSLRHGGELLERRYREQAERPRRLVLVCDVSGSMAPYSRMLLQYLQACVASRARVEAFVFGTRLTRVTRELAGRDPDRALARAADQVIDWSGGTRIGAALAELNREHGRRIGRGAMIVVLSDGWDRGDPDQLADEMARLRRCAHRVVWLNPLAADARYEPLTRGMQAALPHVDHLLPGNTIASLEALAELMEEGITT
jgi:uncharacterized protein with von Willebrand factor type A (vWA) domain